MRKQINSEDASQRTKDIPTNGNVVILDEPPGFMD